jgi:hypothetical protein
MAKLGNIRSNLAQTQGAWGQRQKQKFRASFHSVLLKRIDQNTLPIVIVQGCALFSVDLGGRRIS